MFAIDRFDERRPDRPPDGEAFRAALAVFMDRHLRGLTLADAAVVLRTIAADIERNER